MTSFHVLADPQSPNGSFPGAFAWGLAAGVAVAAGALLGRKVAAQAKVGHGHSLKHRTLDLAAAVMQPKYPLAAMSTFLSGCGTAIITR
jgi:hypothetical protein